MLPKSEEGALSPNMFQAPDENIVAGNPENRWNLLSAIRNNLGDQVSSTGGRSVGGQGTGSFFLMVFDKLCQLCAKRRHGKHQQCMIRGFAPSAQRAETDVDVISLLNTKPYRQNRCISVRIVIIIKN